jgi:competence protein ComEA
MKNRDKIIGSVAIIFIFIVFFLYGIFNNGKDKVEDSDIFVENSVSNSAKSSSEEGVKKQNETIQNKVIKVQIKGEIKEPGVYTVSNGERIEDLIKLAGGFTAEADVGRVVSQAKKLRDEECIVIPKKGAGNELTLEANNTPVVSNVATGVNEKINVNTATKEELMKVPGIGEVIASSIMEYREKNGDFNSLEDLKNVNRIGDKTLEKFKDKLEVN